MVKLLSKIGAFFRNVVVLKWAVQFIFLGGLIALIFNYLNIAVGNLANTNIAFSWGFLGETPGVSIAEGLYTLPKSGLQMLQTGMLNMLRITVTGIIAATFFGTILGIARLSNNYIVEKTATSLLEVVRNVPLLVQILFFQALILSLPRLEVYDVGSVLFHASSKGVALSWPNRQDGAWMFMLYFLITLYISNRVYKQRVKLLEEQGRETKPFLWSVSAFVILFAVGWYGGYRIVGIIGFVSGFISQGLEVLPGIFYQVLLSAAAGYLSFISVRRQIKSKRSGELQGKYSDDDYFKMIITIIIAIVFIALMFAPVGQGIAKFLVGDELTFKSDWGLPQFFGGISNALDWSITGLPYELNMAEIEQVGTTKFKKYSTEVGKSLTVGYFATWLGVVIYTAIFISEIVRAGIMAVSKGQSEAGLSLGLRRSSLLRLIVLPQAVRIMLPPMGNQYLNLAKNTSLGIAVGFPEVVAVGQTLYNQEGQTLPVFLIWMIFFSTVSLTLSSIVNYYNRKLKIVER